MVSEYCRRSLNQHRLWPMHAVDPTTSRQGGILTRCAAAIRARPAPAQILGIETGSGWRRWKRQQRRTDWLGRCCHCISGEGEPTISLPETPANWSRSDGILSRSYARYSEAETLHEQRETPRRANATRAVWMRATEVRGVITWDGTSQSHRRRRPAAASVTSSGDIDPSRRTYVRRAVTRRCASVKMRVIYGVVKRNYGWPEMQTLFNSDTSPYDYVRKQ